MSVFVVRNEKNSAALRSSSAMSLLAYVRTSGFWFESFQNWQSEFLAVFAIVVFSIWLREKGSPDSSPSLLHAARPESKKMEISSFLEGMKFTPTNASGEEKPVNPLVQTGAIKVRIQAVASAASRHSRFFAVQRARFHGLRVFASFSGRWVVASACHLASTGFGSPWHTRCECLFFRARRD